MRQYVITLLFALCLASTSQAQTFLQRIQQKAEGKAGVTVVQSKEIDELVNKADVSGHKRVATKPATPAQPQKETAATLKKKDPTPAKKEDNIQRHDSAVKHEPAKEPVENKAKVETEPATVDMHKKMPRRSYKVNGYRVQVFAGGNSRDDKNKAQKAGNEVKAVYPELPVYVHFYSPRWICRIGNFRTYEEANTVLRQVKKMGYKQACIVSGKITVAY